MNRVIEQPSYEPSYFVIGLLLVGAYVLACWGDIVSTIYDGMNFCLPHASNAESAGSRPRAQPSSCKTRQPQEETKQEQYNQEPKQEPFVSKRQRKRQMAAQREYENSKEGRKRYKVKGFVIDIGHRDVFGAGNVYGVAFMDLVWTMELPAFFQIADQEWKALLAEADRNETWRRTRNPDAFRAALAKILHNRVTQRLNNQQRRNSNQQQQYSQQYSQHGQRDHHQQRDQIKHTKPAAHVPLSGKYVAAAAEQPDLAFMSVAQLREFIKQSGSPLAVAASSCKDEPELLSLAQCSMQLWECKRIISCSKLPHSNKEQELLAALCVLRVQTGQGPRQPAAAARSAEAADVKKRYQRLALLVHPDKAAEHQQQAGQFDEAFKVLGHAYALVSSHCAAS